MMTWREFSIITAAVIIGGTVYAGLMALWFHAYLQCKEGSTWWCIVALGGM